MPGVSRRFTGPSKSFVEEFMVRRSTKRVQVQLDDRMYHRLCTAHTNLKCMILVHQSVRSLKILHQSSPCSKSIREMDRSPYLLDYLEAAIRRLCRTAIATGDRTLSSELTVSMPKGLAIPISRKWVFSLCIRWDRIVWVCWIEKAALHFFLIRWLQSIHALQVLYVELGHW